MTKAIEAIEKISYYIEKVLFCENHFMEKYVNTSIVNQDLLQKNVEYLKQKKIIIPTFKQLANPKLIPQTILDDLKNVDINAPNPLNLFRISWHNDIKTGGFGDVNCVYLPPELTGIQSPIYVMLGKRFPTGCHKVGATFGPLVSRIVTGGFDPQTQKSIWPSTGNYCRGGAFNSTLLGCPAIAIMPENVSQERFNWLESIGAEIFKTPSGEDSIKQLFDKSYSLVAENPGKVVNMNQFEEFANPLFHYHVTGPAIEEIFEKHKKSDKMRLAAVCMNQGSAGTIASGMYLHKKFPHILVGCSEALQCPTLLNNGYGNHRIEGIGDKHVPFILNCRDQDVALAINDEAAISMFRLFNTPEGHQALKNHGVSQEVIDQLNNFGISGCANIIGLIKMAKHFEFNENDVLVTVATDSAERYQSRLVEQEEIKGKYTVEQAYADYFRYVLGATDDHLEELTYTARKRIHGLKYFTWVEQRGKTVEELDAQWYNPEYWDAQMNSANKIDELIEQFNQKTGLI